MARITYKKLQERYGVYLEQGVVHWGSVNAKRAMHALALTPELFSVSGEYHLWHRG